MDYKYIQITDVGRHGKMIKLLVGSGTLLSKTAALRLNTEIDNALYEIKDVLSEDLVHYGEI